MPLRIVYNAGGGDVVVDAERGPVGFTCARRPAKNVNVAASGVTETVTERQDLVISFLMPAIFVSDDFGDWAGLMAWAERGNSVKLYPNVSAYPTEYYDVIDEGDGFAPRKGPGVGRYSADFIWRILPTAQAPAGGQAQVMQRYYAGGAPPAEEGDVPVSRAFTGAINGANTVYTFTDAITAPGSLQVFLNGLLLRGGGVDYTWDGGTLTLTMVSAPLTGDLLTVFYV